MRTKAQLSWLGLVVVLAACDAKSTSVPIPTHPSTPTRLTISASKTITPTVKLTPTSTPNVSVVTQPVLADIEWAIYMFDAGVSFEYPHDWIIMASQEDSVEFLGFPYLPYNVRVNIYHREAMTDPHSAVPNEGRYEVLWEKPISIENADGLEFIWGIPAGNQIGGILNAIYYSEQHQIQVVLSTDADIIPTESNKFSVFEYMVQSVRICP